MPRWPEKREGMEKPKRARRRKPDTSQGGPEATNLKFSGGQGPVSAAYQAVDSHTRYRLRQWLRRKHEGRSRPGVMHYPDEYLYDSLGLVRLERRTRNFPWAKA